MADSSPIIIEAEALTLSANYVKESSINQGGLSFASGNDLIRLITATAQGEVGTATGNFSNFNGATGIYTITVNIFDENDGNSQGTLTIGNTVLPSFSYDQDLGVGGINENNRRAIFFSGVAVKADDDIVFAGTRDNNEVARLDNLVFTPVVTGALEFSVDSLSVSESAGKATITVTRTGGTLGETTATINLSNGTSSDDDYDSTAQTVVLQDGETSATIDINITDDQLDELDETVILTLASISGQSILADQTQAILTILDDDVPAPPNEPPNGEPPNGEPPTPNAATEGDDILFGTTADDTLNLLGGNDVFRGGDGNDVVEGGEGDDNLFGEAGDDELSGDSGNDLLNGGPGEDTLDGGAGRDTLRGGGGDDVLGGGGGRDRLIGSAGNDTLNGDGGADILNGGGGNDILNGGGGRDRIRGGGGSDTLNGGGGRDTILGNGGSDTLTGGGGSDTLTGGGGADIFVLEARAGVDRVTDFNLNQDRLQLSGSLSFSDLTIRDQSGDTLIAAGGNRLAILIGIDANQISASSFV